MSIIKELNSDSGKYKEESKNSLHQMSPSPQTLKEGGKDNEPAVEILVRRLLDVLFKNKKH